MKTYQRLSVFRLSFINPVYSFPDVESFAPNYCQVLGFMALTSAFFILTPMPFWTALP